MQTFSFKRAKLLPPTKVEADRKWVRITQGGRQTHIDFHTLERMHYWETKSRGISTGHLHLVQRSGKTVSLQASSFAMSQNFEEFVSAASMIMDGVGKTRPEVQVEFDAPLRLRVFYFAIVALVAIGIAAADLAIPPALEWSRVLAMVLVVTFVIWVGLFRFNLLRGKPLAKPAGEVAKQLATQVRERRWMAAHLQRQADYRQAD